MFGKQQRLNEYPPRLTPIGTPSRQPPRAKRSSSTNTKSTASQEPEPQTETRQRHDEPQPSRDPEPEGLCALRIGSCCCGVPCSIHISYFILLAIEIFTAILIHRVPEFVLLTLIIYCPVLLMSLALHEAGHCMATIFCGGRIRSVVIWPLGGFTVCGVVERGDVLDEIWVAMAGPFMHIPQVAFWVAVYAFASGGDFSEFRKDVDLDVLEVVDKVGFLQVVAQQACILNAALFLFNLGVPCYPLDCGRCLAAILVSSGWSIHTTCWILSILSIFVGFCLSAWGFWVFIFIRSTGGIFMVIVACFILHFGQQLLACARRDNAVATLNHPLFDQPCYRVVHRAAMLRTENVFSPVANTGSDEPAELTIRRTRVTVV